MKKIVYLFAITIMMFSMYSCTFETYATTQDDIYYNSSVDIVRSDVDVNLVIRFGTPFYYEGSLLYYLYNDIYYYPYYYNSYWYFRAYRRPFTYIDRRPYFRPHKYDYRFGNGYRSPRNWYRYDSHRSNYSPHRPNISRPNVSRPNVGRPNVSRPNVGRPTQSMPRPSSPRMSIPSTPRSSSPRIGGGGVVRQGRR